jgi:hypothetical protein
MSALQVSPVSLVRHDRGGRGPAPAALPSHGRLTARLALDRKTRAHAFAVRHDSYLSGGYIDRRPDGLFADEFDDMPNSQTVVVYRDGRPVASIRFCIIDTDPAKTGWQDIPASRIFPDEVKGLLDQATAGRVPPRPARALEINRLVRHPDFADDKELVFVLFRFATYMVLHHEADITLSCVRRNHMPFYRRIIKLSNVAGPRRYAGVKFETHLMACDRSKYESVVRDVPIFNCAKITAGGYDALFEGETVSVFQD